MKAKYLSKPWNPHLIEAAPDLLEAAKEALELIENLNGPLYDFEATVTGKLKAAIAKAEGK